MLPTKKLSTWVSPSFDFTATLTSSPPTAIHLTNSSQSHWTFKQSSNFGKFTSKTQKSSSEELWVNKHAPKTSLELAVHRKKVSDVESWLEQSYCGQHGKAPILLLTGETGSGKTITLQTLAKEMKIEVKEWSNPLTTSYNDDHFNRPREFGEIAEPAFESHLSKFTEFLFRANRYSSVGILNEEHVKRKIILVEDFPNVFLRDAKQFHDVLRNFKMRGRCPIVFIVSNSASSNTLERTLFPLTLQSELYVTNISFNPIAPTVMIKILTKIIATESSENRTKVSAPDKETLELLVKANAGDIRGAINAVQFSCQKCCKEATTMYSVSSTSSKRGVESNGLKKRKLLDISKRREKTAAVSQHTEGAALCIGGRDTTVSLFRALGKVLHCKRDIASDIPSQNELPTQLTHQYRDPLSFDPEDVIEKSQMSGEYFVAFLHQNYLDFYTSLDDVINASEYVSDSDFLSADWATRQILEQYAVSVATRGLLFANASNATASSERVSGFGWKPLHKPEWQDVVKKARENCELSLELFPTSHLVPTELQTQLIPYLSLAKFQPTGPQQLSFVHEVGRIATFKQRHASARLGERDTATLLEDAAFTEEAQYDSTNCRIPLYTVDESANRDLDHTESLTWTCETNEDEEIIIDDFDD